ncbi:hypothetical protein ACLOJK_009570 [Asimina triloba]
MASSISPGTHFHLTAVVHHFFRPSAIRQITNSWQLHLDRATSSGPPRQRLPRSITSRKPNPNQIRSARQQLQPQIKASAISHGQHQPPIDDPSPNPSSKADLDPDLGDGNHTSRTVQLQIAHPANNSMDDQICSSEQH